MNCEFPKGVLSTVSCILFTPQIDDLYDLYDVYDVYDLFSLQFMICMICQAGQIYSWSVWSVWSVWSTSCCRVGAVQSAWSSPCFMRWLCAHALICRSCTTSHNGRWGTRWLGSWCISSVRRLSTPNVYTRVCTWVWPIIPQVLVPGYPSWGTEDYLYTTRY